MNFNEVLLAGNLTRDVELKMVGNDNQVCSFGLAINRKYKTKAGELKEDTTFVDVSAWGKTAGFIAQYFAKGQPIFICGSLRLESWDDKATGQKRSKLTVVADQAMFVGRPENKERSDASASRNVAASAPVAPSFSSDEPPF
jgi:single-strand DNA-binding protein